MYLLNKWYHGVMPINDILVKPFELLIIWGLNSNGLGKGQAYTI